MRLIRVKDDMYVVRGTVSVNTEATTEELKCQFDADTVLRKDNKFYLCQKVIDVDYEDI